MNFVGNSNREIDLRCAINRATKSEIIGELQELLQEKMLWFGVSKHVDEIAVAFSRENFETHDIVLKRRNNGKLQRVFETHRSYDALRYPLIFCYSENCYLIKNKMNSNKMITYNHGNLLQKVCNKFNQCCR